MKKACILLVIIVALAQIAFGNASTLQILGPKVGRGLGRAISQVVGPYTNIGIGARVLITGKLTSLSFLNNSMDERADLMHIIFKGQPPIIPPPPEKGNGHGSGNQSKGDNSVEKDDDSSHCLKFGARPKLNIHGDTVTVAVEIFVQIPAFGINFIDFVVTKEVPVYTFSSIPEQELSTLLQYREYSIPLRSMSQEEGSQLCQKLFILLRHHSEEALQLCREPCIFLRNPSEHPSSLIEF